ncbi:hypothetical protein K0B96_05620 [Horticoccus luteus]|uniref:Sulfotransferase family protein n=1 Tax=Horticoccus luteus TaxID=2862869 RepID=A0A8F9XMJ1_9BACT|nr:hypothetical protein [Horticoccus luteus]QYM80094.1 hypothetical protein K0B96_05620 [Horticoccus luteus]
MLLEQAELRETHRRTYAALRANFLSSRTARRAGQAPVPFKDGSPAIPANAVWTIVTGLPRAGLSLLLRMLAFGGYPVLTDGRRPPDVHNPLGYFEWAPAARLHVAPRLIDEAANHALKLPADALSHLPRDRRYRVLFVTRDPEEIARSQATVLGKELPAEAAEQLARRASERLAAARADSAFDVLEVPFNELRRHPAEWAARLTAFLGPERLRRPEAMAGAIHPDLPRHRRA